MHLIFGESREEGPLGRPLDLHATWDLSRAIHLAEKELELTYVFEGPDADEASELVLELLQSGRPTFTDAMAGIDRTVATTLDRRWGHAWRLLRPRR